MPSAWIIEGNNNCFWMKSYQKVIYLQFFILREMKWNTGEEYSHCMSYTRKNGGSYLYQFQIFKSGENIWKFFDKYSSWVHLPNLKKGEAYEMYGSSCLNHPDKMWFVFWFINLRQKGCKNSRTPVILSKLS